MSVSTKYVGRKQKIDTFLDISKAVGKLLNQHVDEISSGAREVLKKAFCNVATKVRKNLDDKTLISDEHMSFIDIRYYRFIRWKNDYSVSHGQIIPLKKNDYINDYASFVLDEAIKAFPIEDDSEEAEDEANEVSLLFPSWIEEIVSKLSFNFVNDTKWRKVVDGPCSNFMVYLDDSWSDEEWAEFNRNHDKERNDYVYCFVVWKYYFLEKSCLSEDINVLSGEERCSLMNSLALGNKETLLKYVDVFLNHPAEVEHILYLYKSDTLNYDWYKQWFDVHVNEEE